MGHEALEGSQKAYVIFDPDYLSSVRDVLEVIASDLRRICPEALVPPARISQVPTGNQVSREA